MRGRGFRRVVAGGALCVLRRFEFDPGPVLHTAGVAGAQVDLGRPGYLVDLGRPGSCVCYVPPMWISHYFDISMLFCTVNDMNVIS